MIKDWGRLMLGRVGMVSVVAALAATSVIGMTASNASPSIRSVGSLRSVPDAPVKPAPLLTVHVVAKTSVPFNLYASGSGTYLLVAPNENGDGALYNTETNKQVGGEIGPPEAAVKDGSDNVIGVDDQGVVFGTADRSVNGNDVNTGFTWSDGKAGWISNPSPTEVGEFANCNTGTMPNPVTDVNVEIASVNPQGATAATVVTDCGPRWSLAMTGGSDGHWSPTGKTSEGLTGYAATAATIDAAGEVLGTVVNATEAPQYVWAGTGSGAKSLATLTGFPNASAATHNNEWNGTHFIGVNMTHAGGLAVWEGGQAFNIPEPANPVNGSFFAEALGPGDEVIGQATSSENAIPVASVWYRGGKVTPLRTLVHKTSVQLVYAYAVDRRGDIFGVGFQGGSDVLYEARVQNPPPTVSIKAPKSGHAYAKGAVVKASYSCKAGTLGKLKSCKGTVADHHRISTSKFGKHTFTVTATDADGEKTMKRVHYTVKK
jgi:hypothetical protein